MYLEERFAHSCGWFLDSPTFQDWISLDRRPLLWLTGRAGSGKSTLCSSMIQCLQERSEQGCAIVFNFFDSRQSQASSARYVLKVLAYQLRSYMRHVGSEYLLQSKLRACERLTEPTFLERFQHSLGQMFENVVVRARIFIVLDGLKDDDAVRTIIMQEILRVNRLRDKAHVFKCVISSRSTCTATIDREDLLQVNLDIELGIQHDMLRFAKTRLDEILGTPLNEKGFILNLAKQLCSRASGNFLWLALAIEEIQRMQHRPDMLQIVYSLPPTVNEFYQKSLQQIPSQDVATAQNIFSWLTCASRPLYFPELLEALALRADRSRLREQPLSNDKSVNPLKAQSEIHRVCGWLVTVSNQGIVRLRHPTLREYLLFTVESLDKPCQPVLAAHELLARSCLMLLNSYMPFEASLTSTDTKPAQRMHGRATSALTKYATANWSVHYLLCETYSKNLAGTLQRCLTITLEYDCQSFSMPKIGRSIQIANTTLRISASYGLISLTRLCLQMGADPKGGSCALCESPLTIAAGRGHTEAANIIMQRVVDPATIKSYDADEAISHAVFQGSTDVVRSFLECGTKVNTVQQSSGKTLLHIAAHSGRLEMVQLLMSYDADVNSVIRTTQETPLHLAAAQGHAEVVNYLVDGRDSSMKELELYDLIISQSYYQSWKEDLLSNGGMAESLVWEVEARDSAQQHVGQLRSFLNRYSNLDLRNAAGRTALDLAASHGHNDVVRFLLERGANLESQFGVHSIALQGAVENGHLETVKSLLTAGARLYQDTKGLAPILQRAYQRGHGTVAELVYWHFFIAEFSVKRCPWPLLCLPTKANNTVVREAIRKKLHLKFSRHNIQSRIPQRLGKLVERSRYY